MMSAEPSRGLAAGPGGARYLQAVGDLMAGLLVLFMLVAMVFALTIQQQTETLEAETEKQESERSKFEQQVQRLEQARNTRDRLLTQLQDRLRTQHKLEVEIDFEQGVLRLGENAVNFESAAHSCTVGEPGCAVRNVAEALSAVLPCYVENRWEAANCPSGPPASYVDSVLVEGHTDASLLKVGAPSQCRDNLCLSTFRANWTYGELMAEWPEGNTLTNGSDQRIFGVSGYGDARPVVDVDCRLPGDPCAGNRRIDLRFIMEPPAEYLANRSEVAPQRETRRALEASP